MLKFIGRCINKALVTFLVEFLISVVHSASWLPHCTTVSGSELGLLSVGSFPCSSRARVRVPQGTSQKHAERWTGISTMHQAVNVRVHWHPSSVYSSLPPSVPGTDVQIP